MPDDRQRVVVLGASSNPERTSNLAVKRLKENRHEVIPVHPTLDRIEGLEVAPDLRSVGGRVDTLTVYVSPEISSTLTGEILDISPGRVIFNPGAENPELEAALHAAGIETLQACTIVLLTTGQF